MPWEGRKKILQNHDWDTILSSASPDSITMTFQQSAAAAAAHLEDNRLVKRLKNTNPEKFSTMVKMHLSFLLDLHGSFLDELLGDSCLPATPTDSSKPRTHSGGSGGNSNGGGGGLFSFAKRKHNKEMKAAAAAAAAAAAEGGVFGMPLCTEVIERVFPLFEILSQPQNLSEEGLFRKSGNMGRQRLLRERLQSDSTTTAADLSEYSVHDCASVLKAFLAELPEPLLTDKHYQAFCQVPTMTDGTKRLSTVQLLVQLMPRPHYVLLECVLELLHRVLAHESDNKMTADALGMLFAPTILAPRTLIAKDLHVMSPSINTVVAFLVEHAQRVTGVPADLVRDIRTYWDEVDELPDMLPTPRRLLAGTDSMDSMDEDSARRHRQFRKRLHVASVAEDHAAIHTNVTFTDRPATQLAAATTDTETALAQLYAHVSQMPESAKKRKLLKQFSKANHQRNILPATPNATVSEKHKRTRSLGESIKKMVSRGGTTSHSKQACYTPKPVQHYHTQFSSPSRGGGAVIKNPPVSSPCRTPVHRLFADRIRAAAMENSAQLANSCSSLGTAEGKSMVTNTTNSSSSIGSNIGSSSVNMTSCPNSPLVHIVDMKVGCSVGGLKRKATDSPMLSAAATQTSLTMLSNYIAGVSSAASSSSSSIGGRLEKNKENARPSFSSASSGFMSPKMSTATSTATSTDDPRHVQFGARCNLVTAAACEFSPISKSITTAPKSVQQCAATPGSRKAMAFMNTP